MGGMYSNPSTATIFLLKLKQEKPMEDRIGAQLYTLRDFTKTPKDIAESMEKVSRIGYRAVQVSGMGPIDAGELKGILDGEGLKACATHISFNRIQDEIESVIEEHNILACPFIAIGGLPVEYRGSAEGFRKFAKEASAAARKLKEAGFVFGYHNHSFELEKFDGKTAMQIMFEESDPDVFTFEIDTYWIQHGGGDPAAYIRQMKGRIPLLHLKDMAVHEGKPVMAEVGEGNLNWERIISEAENSGVEWYLVEQDTCLRDPFESLEISYNNLKKML